MQFSKWLTMFDCREDSQTNRDAPHRIQGKRLLLGGFTTYVFAHNGRFSKHNESVSDDQVERV